MQVECTHLYRGYPEVGVAIFWKLKHRSKIVFLASISNWVGVGGKTKVLYTMILIVFMFKYPR